MNIPLLRHQIQRECQARDQLESQLLQIGPARGGSLLVRYTHKGRITSRKKRGRKGPYYFVSCKGRHCYIRPHELERLQRLLGNHKKFRDGLRALKELNEKIVTRLKELWRHRTQEGAR